MNNIAKQDVEREHFDSLVVSNGETFWGNTTKAGIKRLERRVGLLKQELGCYSKPKVFELGCGTGAFSKYILQEFPLLDLFACDISPECIRVASERYGSFKNAKFFVNDIIRDRPNLDKFDVIIGNSILHHLPIKTCLEYCFKSLSPHGRIMFFEPNMLNPQIAIEKNIYIIGKRLQNTENETAFFRWSLKKILQEVGFKEVSIKPFDFLHPIIPSRWVDFFDKLGRKIETLPILKEFSGSLIITAVKS